jgi:hypothetical protein
VATKTCTVSFTGPSGVCHSVELSADSLYEAAIVGFSLLKQDGWVDPVAPGTRLDIHVRHPATTHRVSLAQLRRWVEGIAVSPDETLQKRRLKDPSARRRGGKSLVVFRSRDDLDPARLWGQAPLLKLDQGSVTRLRRARRRVP